MIIGYNEKGFPIVDKSDPRHYPKSDDFEDILNCYIYHCWCRREPLDAWTDTEHINWQARTHDILESYDKMDDENLDWILFGYNE